MAPRGRRGEAAEPQGFHQLGVRGRKTGVALANTGEVDDQGFQPLDSIFSSPQKGPARSNGGADVETDDDDDDAGSQDMDIASSAGPGPRTLLKNQRNSQYQLPRSRSPVKTRLTSPPKRNPHLERLSSPLREDRDLTVTRQLDFSGKARRGRPNGVNGAVVEEEEEEEDESDDASRGIDEDVEDVDEIDDLPEVGGTISDDDNDDQSLSEDEPEPSPEPEPEPVEPSPSTRKAPGRPKAAAVAKEVVEAPSPSSKKKGRSPKTKQQPVAAKPQDDRGAKKRRSIRSSTGSEPDVREDINEEPEEPEERQVKRQKTTKEPAKPAPAKRGRKPGAATAASAAAKADGPPKSRGRPAGRKPKQVAAPAGGDDAGEASFMALQKGPPMPKRPGLVSMRRDPDVIMQTKSGRHSFKPLAWWAGEQVITEDEEQTDMFKNGSGFVLNSMKEIVRVEDEEPPRAKKPAYRSRGRPKAKPRMQSVQEEEEEEELEEWEADPGAVMSEVIAWEPEYETHPPGDDDQVHISEEQIALSGHAVETREIRDATFRFAKTLTMPFMGAGVVDLPPGAEKRPKNSRKMHMVFFVHTGKVAVTVNEGHFRISKGGQWFVPRGNYYSISNDYQQPARIFFAQACEISPQIGEASESMLMATES